MQLDDTIDTNWAVIFIPLWVVYGAFLLYLLLSVCRGPSERPVELEEGDAWEDDDPLSRRQWHLAEFTIFVLFQAVIVAKLDGRVDTPWPVALLPYYAYELMVIFDAMKSRGESLLLAATREEIAAEKDSNASGGGGDFEHPLGFADMAAADVHRQEAYLRGLDATYYTFRLIQVFLIGLMVEGILGNPSWWTVLVPTIVYVALLCCVANHDGALAKKDNDELQLLLAQDIPEDSSYRDHEEYEHERSSKAQRLKFHATASSNECSSCVCWALYLL